MYVRFKDGICAAVLAEMETLSFKSWGVIFIMCDRCFHQICSSQIFEVWKRLSLMILLKL